MAPKKAQSSGTKAKTSTEVKDTSKNAKSDNEAAVEQKGEPAGGKGSKKRKAGAEASNAPNKSARRSERSAPPTNLSSEEQVKILNYLLSPASLEQTRPKDEKGELESRGGDEKLRTYSASEFSPLEELISAMILSRPIGRKCCSLNCYDVTNSNSLYLLANTHED